MAFKDEVNARRSLLEDKVRQAVALALKGGADECEVVIQGSEGLEVSTRHAEVENIEFNKAAGMEVVVFKDKRRGIATTTDLSAKALADTVEAAIAIAAHTDRDPCAGICEKELLCTGERDLDMVHALLESPDAGIERAAAAERCIISELPQGIKDSDGAGYESILNLRVLGNSHGFCKSSAATYHYTSMTLIGEKDGTMQRGAGYSIARDPAKLGSPKEVAKEALERTLAKLGASQVPTGRYNVIFSRQAALSLWGHLLSAIAGGSVYRKTSFLSGKLNEQIFPDFITLHEDPFIPQGLASFNFDAEGLQVRENDVIKDGILTMYLLSTYTGRKLGMRSNAHAGGMANGFVNADAAHTRDFDEMLREAGEGLVITDLMGQGVDLVSGNYSRGAAGFYFKNGEKVHPVEEITVAGNLKDMFLNLALVGSDRDPRTRLQCGSLLIPDMTVSGS